MSGIRCGKGRAFSIDGAQKIIDTLGLKTLKSPPNKKADIELTIRDSPTTFDTISGYSIKSYLGSTPTLFNPSGATNFRFNLPDVDDALAEKINAIEGAGKVIRRLKLIERLEFDSVVDRTFANNLRRIETHMDKILSEMVKLHYVERISGCAELATRLEEDDPLNFHTPNSYRLKIKKFLCAVALGLRATHEWNGRNEAAGGCIVVKRNAEIVLYPLQNHDDFETYLLNETYLDTPSTKKFNYATISGGGGQKYIDLNLQIRFK